jgi:hypothetical protein
MKERERSITPAGVFLLIGGLLCLGRGLIMVASATVGHPAEVKTIEGSPQVRMVAETVQAPVSRVHFQESSMGGFR